MQNNLLISKEKENAAQTLQMRKLRVQGQDHPGQDADHLVLVQSSVFDLLPFPTANEGVGTLRTAQRSGMVSYIV